MGAGRSDRRARGAAKGVRGRALPISEREARRRVSGDGRSRSSDERRSEGERWGERQRAASERRSEGEGGASGANHRPGGAVKGRAGANGSDHRPRGAAKGKAGASDANHRPGGAVKVSAPAGGSPTGAYSGSSPDVWTHARTEGPVLTSEPNYQYVQGSSGGLARACATRVPRHGPRVISGARSCEGGAPSGVGQIKFVRTNRTLGACKELRTNLRALEMPASTDARSRSEELIRGPGRDLR